MSISTVGAGSRAHDRAVDSGTPWTTLPHLLDFVVKHASASRLALMLYGSQARGTSDGRSDVDILELVAADPASYQLGNVNVTQYTPQHLRQLGRAGSLFILHLRQEGQVLDDPFGVLQGALDVYRRPANYDATWSHLRVAAGALDAHAELDAPWAAGLAKLGIYLLRTAAYLRCLERGVRTFDLNVVESLLQTPSLSKALNLRKADRVLTLDDVRILREELHQLLGRESSNPYGSLEAFAVAHADQADLASLLAGVMDASATLNYSALTLPPM